MNVRRSDTSKVTDKTRKAGECRVAVFLRQKYDTLPAEPYAYDIPYLGTRQYQ